MERPDSLAQRRRAVAEEVAIMNRTVTDCGGGAIERWCRAPETIAADMEGSRNGLR